MEEFKFESFKVKSSKSGHIIPVVNGVHLHSTYDPIKEAKSMVEKYYKNFKENKNVLVFGFIAVKRIYAHKFTTKSNNCCFDFENTWVEGSIQ